MDTTDEGRYVYRRSVFTARYELNVYIQIGVDQALLV